MIKIAIIDDEIEVLLAIRVIIEKVIENYDEVEIIEFQEEERLLSTIGNGVIYDVLISDIELDKMNGIDLGAKIQKELSNIYLIFLTAHSEFAAKSYTIDAYQYILKQNMSDRLPYVLNQLIDKIEREIKQFKMIGTSSTIEKVYFKDIISIGKEKSSKYVKYITTEGVLRERTTLELIMKEIRSNDFLVVERGYIINMNHIVSMKNHTIHLTNKEEITINDSRYSEVKKAINLYMREL